MSYDVDLHHRLRFAIRFSWRESSVVVPRGPALCFLRAGSGAPAARLKSAVKRPTREGEQTGYSLFPHRTWLSLILPPQRVASWPGGLVLMQDRRLLFLVLQGNWKALTTAPGKHENCHCCETRSLVSGWTLGSKFRSKKAWKRSSGPNP